MVIPWFHRYADFKLQPLRLLFAAILGYGSFVTWGAHAAGGDSSGVQDRPKNVQQIQATLFAFTGILGDGSVVTWGRADTGSACCAGSAEECAAYPSL